jgi:hypothetical protein
MEEFSFFNIKEWILSGKSIPDDKMRIWNSERCIENGICSHKIIDCPVCTESVFNKNVSSTDVQNALRLYNLNPKITRLTNKQDKFVLDTLFSWNKKSCTCYKYLCKCGVCSDHDMINCPVCQS